jgi:hypothetical protein
MQASWNNSDSSQLPLEYGPWGDWGRWVNYPHSYICGGQVRFEPDQGRGDDTALNGVRFKFCKYVGFESIEFDYDIELAKRNPTTKVLTTLTFSNNSKSESTPTFEISETKSETLSWTNMYGSSLGLEINIKGQIPLISESEIHLSPEIELKLNIESEIKTEKPLKVKPEIKIPACSDAVVTYVVTKDKVTIPYHANLYFEDSSIESISGDFRAVLYFNNRFDVEIVPRSDYCQTA